MDDQVELASKGRVHSIAERNEISSRDRTRFERLLRDWNEQCKLRSSITEIVALPSYQKIIGMGDAAVPLILEQLGQEDEPRHWFWALRVITEANPVAIEDQGDMRKMAQAWASWGQREGYAGQLATA